MTGIDRLAEFCRSIRDFSNSPDINPGNMLLGVPVNNLMGVIIYYGTGNRLPEKQVSSFARKATLISLLYLQSKGPSHY
jgi:hypothetical protein